MNSTIKIEQRDPAELRGHVHPELKSIPELAEDAPEFLAIAAGVGRLGIRQPISVDRDGRVLDDHSRTLLRCALRWQLKTVPVQVLEDVNVPLLIIAGLACRRHFTKSAIAYLAYPLLKPAFDFARARMLQNIAKSPENAGVRPPDSQNKTVEDLAEELGIGRTTLFDAKKVHELFADKKTYAFPHVSGPKDGADEACTLKQWFEPKILRAPIGGEHEERRPMGLGAVVAAIAGKKATEDKPRNATNQMELFSKMLGGADSQVSYWQQNRKAAMEMARAKAERLEPEKCESLAEMHAALAKIYQEQAKTKNA